MKFNGSETVEPVLTIPEHEIAWEYFPVFEVCLWHKFQISNYPEFVKHLKGWSE